MSKKPKASSPTAIPLRVSAQERKTLMKNAKAQGQSVSDYLRSPHPELTQRNYGKVKKET